MRFAHPEVLWLLLALVPLALFALVRWRQARRALERTLSPEMARRLTAHLWPRARALRLALLLGALTLLLVGAARPQRGTHYVTAKRMGRDVVIALDVSESMLAEDLKPNRLQRAKQEISAILDRLRGDRVGLVACAGAAYIQCPLTLDYGAARMFLEFMGPDLVPEPGTSLAEALRVSVRTFDPQSEGFRAVILITDGEDHMGDVDEAARDARQAGARVFAVGIGGEGGEPIPERDATGKIQGYKKDAQGRVVMSHLDAGTLRKIAETTGGLYVPAGGSLGLERVLDEIDRMERREMSGGVRMLYEERFGYLVWPAFLLLLIEAWVPLRRPSRAAAGAATGRRLLAWLRGASAVLLVGSLFTGALLGTAARPARAQSTPPAPPVGPGAPGPGSAPAPAGESGPAGEAWRRELEENEVFRTRHPDDPRPLYNLGNLHHQRGDYDQAERLYQGAMSRAEGDLLARAHYNLGESLFRAGRFEEARASFLETLRRDPQDENAKVNLELTQQRIDQRSAPSDSTQSAPQDSTGRSERSQQQKQKQQSQGQTQPPDTSGQGDQERQQNPTPGAEGQRNPPRADSSQTGEWDQARADSSLSPENLQTMQILRGLENQERELLMRRFQNRARKLRVEKDW